MMEAQDQICCPKCNSNQVSAQKRGYSAGKAVAGVVLTGGIGLAAGLHGKDRVNIHCMKCGFKWNPKDYLKINRQKKTDNSSWDKSNFMKIYESERFEVAEGHAIRNNLLGKDKDIHLLYKELKEEKAQKNMLGAFIAIIVFIVLFWIIS